MTDGEIEIKEVKVSKGDIARDINQFFGIDVNWEKMSKRDLEVLHKLFLDEKRVAQIYGFGAADHRIADVPSSQAPGLLGGLISGEGGGVVDELLQSGVQTVQKKVGEWGEKIIKDKPVRKMLRDRFMGGG